MKEGRDLDILVAQHVLGHHITVQRKGTIKEKTIDGHFRPLRAYSNDIKAAWEVVDRVGITLIPVEGGWFGFVGEKETWKSPADFLRHLEDPDFIKRGAAVAQTAPLTICLAALKAMDNRKGLNLFQAEPPPAEELPAGEVRIA